MRPLHHTNLPWLARSKWVQQGALISTFHSSFCERYLLVKHNPIYIHTYIYKHDLSKFMFGTRNIKRIATCPRIWPKIDRNRETKFMSQRSWDKASMMMMIWFIMSSARENMIEVSFISCQYKQTKPLNKVIQISWFYFDSFHFCDFGKHR